MELSSLRQKLRHDLGAFCWDQWAQLGVFAPTDRNDRWAADPEALLLLTLEAGRSDARLFDETLDWLRVNGRLISVQRLRNLCSDDEDRRLAGAAFNWVSRHVPRARFGWPQVAFPSSPEPLYRSLASEVRFPDESFLGFGFLKAETAPSGKSRPPDSLKPIAFTFRLRHLFGVGTRAEVVRYLIMRGAPGVPAQAIAESAGYAKRNINETLGSLVATGLVTSFEVMNERRYSLSRLDTWGALLFAQPGDWPTHRDWPQLFWALRSISRWVEDTRRDSLSPYLLASEARDLIGRIGKSLAFAGVPIPAPAEGEAYWASFVTAVERALEVLDTGNA